MRRFICNYIYIIKWCFVTTTLCGVLVVCAASTFSFSSSSFSLSQLSLSTYIYPPSINVSLPDLSLSFYVSTSPTSPTSLSLINSLPTCLALSTSVAAWRLPLLASQNASTFRHFAIDSRSSTLVSKCLCSPREGRPNAENSPPSCRSRGNVKNLSSRTSKV